MPKQVKIDSHWTKMGLDETAEEEVTTFKSAVEGERGEEEEAPVADVVVADENDE